jgi:aminoglycoside 3-N-acetyltransferase
MFMSTIRQQLTDLGIKPGDVVLMHSSMKALGTKLTPEEFLFELMEIITQEGTLLLPALTYENVTVEQPVFNIVESEPCVGILPKTFYKMDGVIRSMHPTHSVCAWGARADELTEKHIQDNTPVGLNSPFMLLPEVDGKILFVGDVLHACTFIHGLEEIVKAPYVMKEGQVKFTLIDASEMAYNKMYYVHNFEGWTQEYKRIRDILSYPDIRAGFVEQAPCTLINAAKLKTAALARFKENILAFVSKSE